MTQHKNETERRKNTNKPIYCYKNSGVLKGFIYLLAGGRDEISACSYWLLHSSCCVCEQRLTFIFGDAVVEGILEREEKNCRDTGHCCVI